MNNPWMLVIGDVLISIIAVCAGSLLRFGTSGLTYEVNLLRTAMFFTFAVIVISYMLELYNLDKQKATKELFLRSIMGVFVSFLIITSVYYIVHATMLYRGMLMAMLGTFGVLQVLWHVGYQSIMHSSHLVRKVLVLGTGPLAKKMGELIESTNHHHVLLGYLNLTRESISVPPHAIIGDGQGIVEAIRASKAHKLVVSLSERRGIFPVEDVLNCKFSGIEVIDAPSFYEEVTGKLLIENTTPSWFIFSNGFKMTYARRLYKRVFDIACSIFGLVLTAPLLPFIALLIKLDSRGPVFFRQVRVGQLEKNFMLYKFRTMRDDAEKSCGAVWAQENDPRITRVGSLLRKTRIDELPQLYNVLKGDMSFVGPRPERPEFICELKKQIHYYSERHFVKPGVTGWAQIRYAYGASVEDAIEKLRYDLYYIKNISLFLDMQIILETMKVMLFGRGAR